MEHHQLRLAIVDNRPIPHEWLDKYPPAYVEADILGCRIHTVSLPADVMVLVIEDVDKWIDRNFPTPEHERALLLGRVLIGWGVLAIAPDWERVADAIIRHALGDLDLCTGRGYDVNSVHYPRKEARIESRVLIDSGVAIMVTTYIATMHTEVKLARDVFLTPRQGCIE